MFTLKPNLHIVVLLFVCLIPLTGVAGTTASTTNGPQDISAQSGTWDNSLLLALATSPSFTSAFSQIVSLSLLTSSLKSTLSPSLVTNSLSDTEKSAILQLIGIWTPIIRGLANTILQVPAIGESVSVPASVFKVDDITKRDITHIAQTMPDTLAVLANITGLAKPDENMEIINNAFQDVAKALEL